MKSFSGTVQVLPLIIDDVNVKSFRVRQNVCLFFNIYFILLSTHTDGLDKNMSKC